MFSELVLTITIFFPLVGVIALFFVNKENLHAIKIVGFGSSVLTFIVPLYLFLGFDPAGPTFQFLHKVIWIEGLNISYFVGIDGMALLLVLQAAWPFLRFDSASEIVDVRCWVCRKGCAALSTGCPAFVGCCNASASQIRMVA